tara:strand:- start:188 stop:571 length:384 start_codon:yes stop_codon:yes gene_type:complete
MSFRRAARVDDNQSEVVACFRRLGWSVLIISQLKNCCDIIVAKGGETIAIEIKDGNKPPSARKLSEGEQKFKDNWLGRWELVASVDDVIKLNAESTACDNPVWPDTDERMDNIGTNGNDGCHYDKLI